MRHSGIMKAMPNWLLRLCIGVEWSSRTGNSTIGGLLAESFSLMTFQTMVTIVVAPRTIIAKSRMAILPQITSTFSMLGKVLMTVLPNAIGSLKVFRIILMEPRKQDI